MKIVTIRFTDEEGIEVINAAKNDMRSLSAYCKHAVLASLPRASTITVKRDGKGKFVKLE